MVGVVSYRATAREDTTHTISRSSTLAWSADRTGLWLTSPDDDRVLELDPTTLAVRRRVSVVGQPAELTVSGDELLVTASQSTRLTVIHLGSDRAAPRAIPLPCGGSHSVVAVPAGVGGVRSDLALVTCPTDDLVAVVNLSAGVAVGVVPVAGRPTGVVRNADVLTVSSAGDGTLRTWRVSALAKTLPARPPVADAGLPTLALGAPTRTRAWADGNRSASSLAALDAGPLGTVGAYQVVDNLGRLSAEQVAGDASYGTPVNGRARLEPALAGPCGARFSPVGDPVRSLSGPVALAASPPGAPDADLVWVVGQFSHSVSVVRCSGGPASSHSSTVASFHVGSGARGIVVAADGRSAVVDVGDDHAVARLVLPADLDRGSSSRRPPVLVARRSVGKQHLSALAQQGRRMFTDATDTHLTPAGVVTCASCHAAAGDDGLRWRIETADIAAKVRRTPPVWRAGSAVAAGKPLHWDGEFATAEALTNSTVRELLGGDGLLVDPAPISAYLAETPAPPAAPVRTAAQRAAAARGEQLFTAPATGCASCHTGRAGTDGLAHDVLPEADDPAARLRAAITPTLSGTRARAPYGHAGEAADLASLLRGHRGANGQQIRLSASERLDLIAYLQTR